MADHAPQTLAPPLLAARRFFDIGDAEEAERLCRRHIEGAPDDPAAFALLADIAAADGRLEDAADHLRHAVDAQPTAPMLNDLGAVLERLGRFADAEQCYRQAIDLVPNFAEALNNLANVRKLSGDPEDALKWYEKAIAADPARAEIANNVGTLLRDLERFDEAERYIREALALDPDFAEAWANLGNVAVAEGDTEAARTHYAKSLECRPNDSVRIRMGTLVPGVTMSAAETRRARHAYRAEVAAMLDEELHLSDPVAEVGTTHFFLAYQGMNDREDMKNLARLYAKACPSLNYVAEHCRAPDRGPVGERIRIGFVSPFFHNHTIGRLMEGVVRGLPRDIFETVAFTLGGPVDDLTAAIRDDVDRFHPLQRALSSARSTIAGEKLDILVHAGVGLDPLNYFLGFARLAPVQCVSWGHPVTTGLPTMDYYLSSIDADTEAADAHYSETLVRLGHYTSWYRRPPAPAPVGKVDFGIDETTHVYFCPQSLFKLTPLFDRLIRRILERDPSGEVVLIEGQRPHHTRLITARLEKALGPLMARVRLLPRQPRDRFLGLIAVADVILDIPGFSGGNTSLEAFALGTPIVTWPSRYRRGRLTYALYRQMGIDQGIAANAEDYARIALGLGTDAAARRAASHKILARNGTLFENDAVIAEHRDFFVRAVSHAKTT